MCPMCPCVPASEVTVPPAEESTGNDIFRSPLQKPYGIRGYHAGDLESPKAKSKARTNEARRGQVETALVEKHLKTKLAVAADHFNRDYRKGFQYLQVRSQASGRQLQLTNSIIL